MTIIALDELQRTRLDWPEPLVLDLITEIYGSVSAHEDIWTAARLHARFLRGLIEGETRLASTARLELIASCAARGIDPGAIERAEQAVFRELSGLAHTRFRNSPRLRLQVLVTLQTAQGALSKRAEAPNKRPTNRFVTKRTRAPLRLKPSLASAS